MRDRIPLSQTDEMGPGGRPALKRDGSRLRIVPHDNLCLIRSGQNWSETDAPERKLYLDEVEPVLREGMDFLRDDGLRIGCYANRYMRVLGAGGRRPRSSTA
jgi:aldoxime dehydratase